MLKTLKNKYINYNSPENADMVIYFHWNSPVLAAMENQYSLPSEYGLAGSAAYSGYSMRVSASASLAGYTAVRDRSVLVEFCPPAAVSTGLLNWGPGEAHLAFANDNWPNTGEEFNTGSFTNWSAGRSLPDSNPNNAGLL